MIPSASLPTIARDWRGLAATTLRHLEFVPRPLLDLLLRLGVAGVFWRSGMLKLQSWEFTVFLFRDEYKVPLLPPELAALLGTAVELAAPVLLVLGLGARLGAGALLGLTFVIQVFVYPTSWPEHLLWASVLVYVISNGPGTFSLDHLIRRRLLGGRA